MAGKKRFYTGKNGMVRPITTPKGKRRGAAAGAVFVGVAGIVGLTGSAASARAREQAPRH